MYHGLLLRADSAALAALKSQRVANISLLVFDDGDGRLARLLARSVSQALPGLQVVTAGLTPGANEALYGASEPPPLPAIASADLIAGPWSMAAPHAGLTADESVLAAIAASPAHKIILPRPAPGWQWAGVPEWDEQTAVRDATAAVEQYVAADLADADAPPGPALILLLIAATIAIFALLASLLDSVLPLF
jgi:hypothetical protein